eukprot:CAMPEP_0116123120 /NCGR_PEP_ID=MMETSP0329-20121206/4576_1 /TAXON_ID=697910 /ORGANISM="Pseudo-nitzschia arenysensis, Strain B593" /LENGTH=113 /DNA_ID=CAMNT_0003617009 /DNA_START=76 /DNA_END=417 /DNA_ORIENTATION=+
MAPQTEVEGDSGEMVSTAEELLEERIALQDRLAAVREGLSQVQKENSVLKMKSTIALGQGKLQVESVEDDKNFFIDKYFDLKKKVQAAERSLESKTNELTALESMIQEVCKET